MANSVMPLGPTTNETAISIAIETKNNDAPSELNEDEEQEEGSNGTLLSLETLRESPVQWPEKLPGMTDFLTMSDTPIHMQNIENSQELSPEEVQEMLELGALTPEELVAKIQTLHDEVYQLGMREAKEMTRGKMLDIFSRLGRKRQS